MTEENNTITKEAAAAIIESVCHVNIAYKGEGKEKPAEKGGKVWEFDKWDIRIEYGKTSEYFRGEPVYRSEYSLEYKMGLGHRKTEKAFILAKREDASLARVKNPVKLDRNKGEYVYAIEPKVLDIFHSIVLDGNLAQESFEDFCSNCGYSEDSRKALECYLACQKEGDFFRRAFNAEQREKITKFFCDY